MRFHCIIALKSRSAFTIYHAPYNSYGVICCMLGCFIIQECLTASFYSAIEILSVQLVIKNPADFCPNVFLATVRATLFLNCPAINTIWTEHLLAFTTLLRIPSNKSANRADEIFVKHLFSALWNQEFNFNLFRFDSCWY